MPTITHFEIPADDPERAVNFYKKVFQWKFQHMKEMNYWGITTKKEKEPGINGGLMKRENPGQLWSNYITVNSVDAYLKKVEKFGGKICMPKTLIGDGEFGAIGMFTDTEGNFVGLHEMGKPAKIKKSAPKKAKVKTSKPKKKK